MNSRDRARHLVDHLQPDGTAVRPPDDEEGQHIIGEYDQACGRVVHGGRPYAFVRHQLPSGLHPLVNADAVCDGSQYGGGYDPRPQAAIDAVRGERLLAAHSVATEEPWTAPLGGA